MKEEQGRLQQQSSNQGGLRHSHDAYVALVVYREVQLVSVCERLCGLQAAVIRALGRTCLIVIVHVIGVPDHQPTQPLRT